MQWCFHDDLLAGWADEVASSRLDICNGKRTDRKPSFSHLNTLHLPVFLLQTPEIQKMFFSSLLCSWHFALPPFDEHIMNNWVALKLKQKETGTDKTVLTSFFSYVFIVLSNLSKWINKSVVGTVKNTLNVFSCCLSRLLSSKSLAKQTLKGVFEN